MSANAQPARLIGIPLGDFGLFTCIFLAAAAGFLAFFASCFLAIMSVLIWNTLAHSQINYADTYRYVALPTGLAVMAFSFFFLTGSWLRRKLSGAH